MQVRVLDQDSLRQIHQTTLDLLAEVGVVLTHVGTREMLHEHGARAQGDRVCLPPDLVERCLARCPATVRVQGRDPARAITLGDGSWHTHNVGGVPNAREADGTRRPATRHDNVQATRLLDALPNVSGVTPLFTPQDVPGPAMALWMYYDTVAHTTKPIHGPGVQTAAEVRALAEMAGIACPEGTLTMGISPVSPLTFPDDVVGAILETARQGLPLGPLPCPIMGATAPMAIAGALVQQNAEVLAALVLAQLASPGLPILYSGRLSVMDPHSGLSVWGNPEIGLISAATVQVAHAYGLPVNVYGLCTNAHTADIQNGYERALNALVPTLAGADEISGVGEGESGLSTSLAQIVVDDEILAGIGRVRRGFAVDEDSLALEVMARVMAGPRNFLAERHTRRYMRAGEVLLPALAVRESHSEWAAGGRQEVTVRAAARAAELLAGHEVPPLSEAQRRAMEEVISCAEQT